LSVGDTWIVDVVTELGVTNTLPPTVGVNETCRPLWNPEPLIVIGWGELFRVGLGGEIELITGRVVTSTVKKSGLLHELCCPAALVACMFQAYLTPLLRCPAGIGSEVAVPESKPLS
jgi:hypothetical protein